MATLKEIFEGNTADILEATELLKVLGDREGQFVWKQLTAEGGDFVAYVVADDENSYPDGAMLDGYWYEFYKVLTQSKTVTPKASSQTVTPDEGYYLDSVVVSGDADLVAKNIRKGTNIFGITGTLVAGVSGMECGTVTISANASSITINHNLGVAPSKAYLFNSSSLMKSNTTMNMNSYAFGKTADVATYGSILCQDFTTLTKTKTAVTFPQGGTESYAKWLAGTYYWLVVK